VSKSSVLVIGGPLDGNIYELEVEMGGQIELNSAAGVCVYEFSKSSDGQPVLYFVGPGWPKRSQ
jgi:hypothetical protein